MPPRPFVIRAKILLQELWSRGYDWDDVIHDEIAIRIRSWYGQLRSLGNVQVPRCLHEAKEVVGKRVVTFVDASLQAYGAVAYLQCIYNDATMSSRLVASKCKVAPKAYDSALVETCRSCIGFALDTAFNACTLTTYAICNILFRQHGCVVVDSGSWVELSSLRCQSHWGDTDGDRTIAVATCTVLCKSNASEFQ